MGKHTSGPWKVQQVEYGFAITDQEGYEISPTRNISDARLIAAAPELLAALLAAVECGMVPTSSATEGGAMKYVKQAHVADQIRAAIKKAEGGKA